MLTTGCRGGPGIGQQGCGGDGRQHPRDGGLRGHPPARHSACHAGGDCRPRCTGMLLPSPVSKAFCSPVRPTELGCHAMCSSCFDGGPRPRRRVRTWSHDTRVMGCRIQVSHAHAQWVIKPFGCFQAPCAKLSYSGCCCVRRKAAAARDEAAAATAEAETLEASLREVRCKCFWTSGSSCTPPQCTRSNCLTGLLCAMAVKREQAGHQVQRYMKALFCTPLSRQLLPQRPCLQLDPGFRVCGLLCHVQVRGRAAQRRSDAAAQSSQGGVVKALLAVRASGEIAGIHGRLGVPAFPLA